MSSDIAISNLALGHVGDAAKVSALNGTDGSLQASHCARLLPFAKGMAFEAHDWGFATRRALLAEMVVDADVYSDAEYAYALPTQCARIIGLTNSTDTDFPYRVESKDDGIRILLTDCPPSEAYLRYVYRLDDATKYTTDFVIYLSYVLAGLLAGPLRKADKVKDLEARARETLVRAAGTDSNVDSYQRHKRAEYRPPWIRGR